MPATPPAWTQTPFVARARRRQGVGRIVAVLLVTLASIGVVTWWVVPTTALVWIRDDAAPATDAAFDEFATGFDSREHPAAGLGCRSRPLQ
jgi:hypothetical protein